jgi:hypothetical protein
MEEYGLVDVLEHGTAVVWESGVIVTWNESATFNVWLPTSVPPCETFNNVTAFTNYNATSGTAEAIARRWLKDAQDNHDF